MRKLNVMDRQTDGRGGGSVAILPAGDKNGKTKLLVGGGGGGVFVKNKKNHISCFARVNNLGRPSCLVYVRTYFLHFDELFYILFYLNVMMYFLSPAAPKAREVRY